MPEDEDPTFVFGASEEADSETEVVQSHTPDIKVADEGAEQAEDSEVAQLRERVESLEKQVETLISALEEEQNDSTWNDPKRIE